MKKPIIILLLAVFTCLSAFSQHQLGMIRFFKAMAHYENMRIAEENLRHMRGL